MRLSDNVLISLITIIPPTLASIAAIVATVVSARKTRRHVSKESSETRAAVGSASGEHPTTAERRVPLPIQRDGGEDGARARTEL